MKFTLRFLVFICVAALCLTNGCRDSASQTPNEERINVFDRNRSNVPRQNVPRSESERERQILQGMQGAGNPDAKKTSIVQALWHSVLFLVIFAAAVVGLFYWQAWRKKLAEWEVNDPMALVKELNLVHQLADPEKRLMQELAKKNALSSPLKLFVEPKYLLAAWDDDALIASRTSVRLLLSRLFDITTEIGETTSIAGSNSGTVFYSSKIQKEGK